VPRGRIVEIFGPESSGKTTLALHILASAQREGGEVAFIDVEHALEPAYARALGVDIDNLLISQPDTGEQALEITDALVRSGAVDVVVVDSVAALLPRSELEGEMGESSVGVGGPAHGPGPAEARRQYRKNPLHRGLHKPAPGEDRGGLRKSGDDARRRALKYFSSVRIDVRRIETLKNGSESIGNRTRAKVLKNKVAPPFKEAEFDIIYGEGISKLGEIIDLGVRLELIDKAGAWFPWAILASRAGMGQTVFDGSPGDHRRAREENPGECRQAHVAAGAESRPGRRPRDRYLGGRFRRLIARFRAGPRKPKTGIGCRTCGRSGGVARFDATHQARKDSALRSL
jgi:recombination protein RecA